MWKKLLTLFLLAALLGSTLSKSVLELQEPSEELTHPSAVQVNQARRSSSSVTKAEKVKAAATTTTTAPETSTTSATQRPLIVKYWNNLVERVRSPFSNFTNPLVNLFNDGTSNQVIETPILEYNIEDTTPPKRRRKSGSKRKSAHSTRHRYQAYDLQVNELDYEYDYEQQPQLQYYDQQTIVPAPPARQVYYFYDPNMRRYYGLQAVQPNDYYTTQPQYQHYTKLRKPQPAYYYTEDEYRPSYYRPISSQSHSHRRRRPTSHKQRPKPMRVPIPTTQTIEEPIDEVPTMYEEEQMELAQMQEMQENSQIEQQMQEEAYMPAEGVDVVENFDDEEDEFRKLEGTPELIDTTKEEDEEPEVEDTEAKEEAMLRNALGSFMSDDSLNRQRQRSHSKESTKKAKQTPRYQYYLLRNW